MRFLFGSKFEEDKMKKKILSLALALVMATMSIGAIYFAEASNESIPFIWPVSSPRSVTNEFRGDPHRGLDIVSNASPRNLAVIASGAGTVSRILTGCGNHSAGTSITCSASTCSLRNTHSGFCNWEWGNAVIIRHNDELGVRWTGYAHLASIQSGLAVGQTVTQGQRIGTMGSTGRSGGVHLHFEVWNSQANRASALRDGQPFNPRNVLGVAVQSASTPTPAPPPPTPSPTE
jgi:murein DD-endopeptidase MepM/ murein hydrolase activator NlpD